MRLDLGAIAKNFAVDEAIAVINLRPKPLALYVCHCRECQKQSASAFSLSLMVPAPAFRVTRGTPPQG